MLIFNQSLAGFLKISVSFVVMAVVELALCFMHLTEISLFCNRGYYRCSSSKGCLARKQVERNRSDPGMFIVTYTGEHNHPAPTHRNSLAGSTRQKAPTPQIVTTGDSDKPSSPAQPTCLSPATSMDDELLPQSTNTESREEKDTMEDDEEDEFSGFSDMAVSDDFFAGLEELANPVTGDHFSDHPVNFGLPWVANNAATAAGGI